MNPLKSIDPLKRLCQGAPKLGASFDPNAVDVVRSLYLSEGSNCYLRYFVTISFKLLWSIFIRTFK